MVAQKIFRGLQSVAELVASLLGLASQYLFHTKVQGFLMPDFPYYKTKNYPFGSLSKSINCPFYDTRARTTSDLGST